MATNRRAHSKVAKLPEALRAAIHQAITRGATYDALTEMVGGWVSQGEVQAEAAPSRSGIARYSKDFLARMEKLNLMREQAKTIVTSAAGDGLVLEEAAVNLVLNEIMTILMSTDPEKGLKPAQVGSIAMALSKLQASSASRERVKLDIEKRAREVAKKVTAAARKGGLSKEAIETIERDVLGIAR